MMKPRPNSPSPPMVRRRPRWVAAPEVAIPGQQQVRSLVNGGRTYDSIGLELGVSPGLAYLIATGIPADGSDSSTAQEEPRPGVWRVSTQRLSNPPAANPTSTNEVRAWFRRRAATELTRSQPR